MKCLARKFIAILPYGKDFLNWYARFRLNNLARSYSASGGIFSYMYESNLWGSQESVSGPGSTLEYTKNLRQELPALFRNLNIKSILDAPCGDYNWFRYVERDPSISYLGADIVPALIDKNRTLYSNQNTNFMVLDIRTDKLPSVDLWLCRDVLFHLSNQDVVRAIQNFMDNDIPYLLTSSHPQCEQNTDIPTGSFRLLNLEKSPYNFCKPSMYIDDWVEGFPERRLCLWKKSDLENCLKGNKLFTSGISNQSEA
jgi:Methyltransferase domain